MENVPKPEPITSEPAMTPSAPWHDVHSILTLGLVSCGGVGALLFTAAYLIEGVTRPGYDAWSQPISALSLGPGGWAQWANFVVYGVLLVLSAIGWYRALAPGRDAIWFPLLQSISGVCLIGAGVFSMDPFPGYPPGTTTAPPTTHGMLHTIFAWALILTLAQGCFTLALRFARVAHWRGWAVYSWVTGGLILIFWGMFVRYSTGPFGGLYERLSAGSHDLWLCAITAALLAQQRMKSRHSAWGDS